MFTHALGVEYIEEGVNAVILYLGGTTECVWIKENMCEVKALKLVDEAVRETLGVTSSHLV